MGKDVAAITPAGKMRFVVGDGVALSAAVHLDWRPWLLQQMGSPLPRMGGAIWLPEPHGAVLVSTTTGKVVRTLAFRSEVTNLAESPGGRYLYVALDELMLDATARVSTVIDEFAAESGKLLAHHGIEFGVVPAQLTPVAGGVWVAYRTGKAGSIVLLSASGLAQVPFPRNVGEMSPVPQ
ncbi:MAG TPA: hypothetical protein VK425_02910 [Acidimicrobiales bacterium]|nr:hypothetical protein [Acidimicrobiales bacterium]